MGIQRISPKLRMDFWGFNQKKIGVLGMKQWE